MEKKCLPFGFEATARLALFDHGLMETLAERE
jgi:hypothetical protein